MKVQVDLQNQTQIFEVNKVARQAAGAALLRIGKTVLLATVARDPEPVSEDFLPLTVQYIEKQYAVGRIPGGYIKRETKPGDFETLTSRIIDRSLRPLFPKGYTYPTQITVLVLSADETTDLQTAALNAASAALYLSDIPVNYNVYGVRVGCCDGELKLNPSLEELENSTLDLYLAGHKDELLMIEMRSLPTSDNIGTLSLADSFIDLPQISQNMNEFSESRILEAINLGAKAIEEASAKYEAAFAPYKKADANIALRSEVHNQAVYEHIKNSYASEVAIAINQMAKSERASELNIIANKILASDIARIENWTSEEISNALDKYKRKVVREQIINEGLRADGRRLDEVRPISIETNILPCAHGSCLFTRGQTQALVVATLGGDNDAQLSEMLHKKGAVPERFMFNYNFPGFSVGEASMIKAPGRRELGHGNLAKRALYPSIDLASPYTIRLVSEILESNGSSSMASVCGGSLALRAAGINTVKLVAGVAMGLVFEGEKHAVLTDIMGLEDHDGDMDFKVAGTDEGITALQMDIKLGGIKEEVLKEALEQARLARIHILGLMQNADEQIVLNEDVLPKLELFSVDPSKIVDIIGQAGKTIKEIIEKWGVGIDLDRDKGEVKITGSDKSSVDGAKEHILEITQNSSSKGKPAPKFRADIHSFSIGERFNGVVKNKTAFGAFISLRDGMDGLLHISKIKGELKEGDSINVKIADIKNGKISLELCE